MKAHLPLPALLSHALVAFTVEFDNEFEHRSPHRTSRHGAAGKGPWLVSLVMWSNCMKFVREEGTPAREIVKLAHAATNWHGMVRWGYITIEGPDKIVRPTPKGRQAQAVWQPLFGEMEERWRNRFGAEAVHDLRDALADISAQSELALPECLPILGYGLMSKHPYRPRSGPSNESGLPMAALLSKVLLAFAMDFEERSDLSLAIGANVLRMLDEPQRQRDLPRLSGVSNEAIATALSFLQKRGLAETHTDGRVRIVSLTAEGHDAREVYGKTLPAVEKAWERRYGVGRLREALERIEPDLLRGLEPYPDGWRASVAKPETLPHYPMVLHRGGYPDGS